jgi:hypothetical protein
MSKQKKDKENNECLLKVAIGTDRKKVQCKGKAKALNVKRYRQTRRHKKPPFPSLWPLPLLLFFSLSLSCMLVVVAVMAVLWW